MFLIEVFISFPEYEHGHVTRQPATESSPPIRSCRSPTTVTPGTGADDWSDGCATTASCCCQATQPSDLSAAAVRLSRTAAAAATTSATDTSTDPSDAPAARLRAGARLGARATRAGACSAGVPSAGRDPADCHEPAAVLHATDPRAISRSANAADVVRGADPESRGLLASARRRLATWIRRTAAASARDGAAATPPSSFGCFRRHESDQLGAAHSAADSSRSSQCYAHPCNCRRISQHELHATTKHWSAALHAELTGQAAPFPREPRLCCCFSPPACLFLNLDLNSSRSRCWCFAEWKTKRPSRQLNRPFCLSRK